MPLSKLDTSRKRLLAIMLAVMAPIAAIMAAAVWSNYRFTLSSIDRDYALMTANYASRLRVWIRGTERSLVTAAAGIGAIAENDIECQNAARSIVTSVAGYRAIDVRYADGTGCSYASSGTDFAPERIKILRKAASDGVRYQSSGEHIADTHLYFVPDGRRDVVIQSVLPAKERARQGTALLLVDPNIISMTMALGDIMPGSTIAIVLPDRRVVSIQGSAKDSAQWVPKASFDDRPKRWLEADAEGRSRVYASRPVIDGALYVLGSFDSYDLSRAWYQFLLLLTLPVLVIAALTIAFLRATDVFVIDWLKRLEWAARERGALRDVRVEVSQRMPSEVHSFATAFNTMADAEAGRRLALERALDDNRFLVRELHHRVKNSLQVIQSYLALERRSKTGEARETLMDAELRVQMLSLAYRSALANGTVNAINLSEFLPQLVQMIANSALSPSQKVSLEPPLPATYLELEKVIALGFLLADVIGRAGRSTAPLGLTLTLSEQDGETVLTAEADRPLHLEPEPRVSRGLLLQLGAVALPGRDGAYHIAGWRWPSGKPGSTETPFVP